MWWDGLGKKDRDGLGRDGMGWDRMRCDVMLHAFQLHVNCPLSLHSRC